MNTLKSRISIISEWNCPRQGSILLLDDDHPHMKGLKKLNTVSYYKLPNNALLTMQPRAGQIFTFRSGALQTLNHITHFIHFMPNSYHY
jgi:hypothetical protein